MRRLPVVTYAVAACLALYGAVRGAEEAIRIAVVRRCSKTP